METEIKFLLRLVLDYKLPAEAKKMCLERIGIVEESLANRPRAVTPQAANPMITSTPMAPMIEPPQRVVGGEISTGPGLKGPRKF